MFVQGGSWAAFFLAGVNEYYYSDNITVQILQNKP